jgi:hypothetical protein
LTEKSAFAFSPKLRGLPWQAFEEVPDAAIELCAWEVRDRAFAPAHASNQNRLACIHFPANPAILAAKTRPGLPMTDFFCGISLVSRRRAGG